MMAIEAKKSLRRLNFVVSTGNAATASRPMIVLMTPSPENFVASPMT